MRLEIIMADVPEGNNINPELKQVSHNMSPENREKGGSPALKNGSDNGLRGQTDASSVSGEANTPESAGSAKGRDLGLDLIRITASFMVVMIHTACIAYYYGDPLSSKWMAQNFYASLCRSCVPLFFMVSGVVFLKKKEISPRYIWKKILRLLLVYILFYIFYHAAEIEFLKVIRRPELLIDRLRAGFSPEYNLWFIPELIPIYVMLPFIHQAFREGRKNIEYYLILFFVFSVAKTTILSIPGISGVLVEYAGGLAKLQGIDYFGYFILGWYLNDRLEDSSVSEGRRRLFSALIFTASFAAVVVMTRYYSVFKGTPDQRWYDYLGLFTFLEAVSLFVFIKSAAKSSKRLQASPRLQTLIRRISARTLFIYLIHPFFIDRIFKYFDYSPLHYNCWWSVPVSTLLYWSLSLAVSALVSRIPVINKLF